ncbi:acetamidase/formamidase family protein [Caballeronia sp. AZ10_KS36]|uniref:acetamidase/formamidase family protein n=1 Tax=Caballeronia sp. AZ10_KS36 TaxID=2921757 RepID=UPI0020287D5F|nr:acetamidase/formamidase family protein [Caballeronia sp. AZ10_KS36]
MNLSRFTTESYPGSRRRHEWIGALARFGWKAKIDGGESGLQGTLTSRVSAGGIEFMTIASVAQTLEMSADHADSFILVLLIDGDATLIADGLRERVSPHDIVYAVSGQSASLAFAGSFRAFIVRAPKSAINARLISPLSLRVALLPGASGMSHVFSGFLRSVVETHETLSAEELRPTEVALAEILVACLAGQESKGSFNGLTPSQSALFTRLCRFIETHLADSTLSVATLAKDERVSPRYVHKLFELAGQSFSTYVRSRRLERCRVELVDPLSEKVSISDICFRWGFNDPAHFSRVFRERYGASPRAFRHEASLEMARHLVHSLSRGLPVNAAGLTAQARSEDSGDTLVGVREESDAVRARPARTVGRPHHHLLRATANNVHWGYFSHDLKPVLEVESGDTVTVEALTQHASDDWDRMIAGDAGAESVFHWTHERKNVDRRGAGPMNASIYGRGAGEGFGVHICTGPIAVKDAEPGDVLEVRILDIHPRPCKNPKFHGRAFGSNAAAWWGFHYRELLTEPKPREVVTIYEIHTDDAGDDSAYARAVYNYRWTPQRDPFGVLHPTIDYPGVPVDHASVIENHDVLKNVTIPVRPHFGVIGVAPQQNGLIDSIPPSAFGGNIDNWRVGPGASVFLPVGVAGALLSIGDPHASQGDSELCGTAIECSLTGDFELILHKKHTLASQSFADLTYPLIETADEWVLHGFSHPDYLAEFGTSAQSEVYRKSTLDQAMRDAFIKTRRFLMCTKGLTEDEAISLMSVAVDFGVTQVVDGNWGVHAIIRKVLFADQQRPT